MRKLLIKGSLIGIVLCGLFVLLIFLSAKEPFRDVIAKLTKSESYASRLNASDEVITYIEKAREKDNSTKLIVGDSVCNSLFGELQDLNPDYKILCCNKGITMAGQYILTKEYLENHEGVTDVYLIVISNSLITGFDTDFGYQYAVVPFVKTNTLSHLDEETIALMKDLYFAPFLREDVIDYVEASPFIKKMYLNLEKELKPTILTLSFPDVTTTYIKKMYDLCEEKGITMHFMSPPLAESEERKEVEEVLKKEYEKSILYEMFPDFYENYIYYPAELFPDGIHPYVDRSYKNDMIRAMEEKMKIKWDLKLERKFQEEINK